MMQQSSPEDAEIAALVSRVKTHLDRRRWQLATAESCTGGLLGHVITNEPGASTFYDRGFVTYSNRAKVEHLGVRPATLETHGAVSAEAAEEMAQGVVRVSSADVGLATTGIAGPTGGTPDKPVGTVFRALLARGMARAVVNHAQFEGDREVVKRATVRGILQDLVTWLETGGA